MGFDIANVWQILMHFAGTFHYNIDDLFLKSDKNSFEFYNFNNKKIYMFIA